MSLNVGTLAGILDLDNKPFDSKLDNSDSRMSKLIGTAKKVAVGVGVALAATGVAAFGMSNKFNEAMANVGSLIPGNTARVEELKGSVQKLAISMGKSTGDMADGLYQVVSAFGDTADSTKVLEINAKAATAGVASTTDAINLTSAVTKGYGDTTATAVQKAADLATMTVRLGQTTFPELAASIGAVVPLASELNVKQEELFATMATLTGVTGGAAEVSTQMRGAMQSLMAPTKDMSGLFEKYGVASGEALVEQKGWKGAIALVADEAAQSGKPLQSYISSIEGQTLALALAGAQSDAYGAKLGDMAKYQGATQAAVDAQTKGINRAGFAWQQLKVVAEVAMQKIGDKVGGFLMTAMDGISAWWSANGPMVIAKVHEVRDAIVGFVEQVEPPIRSWVENVLGSLSRWWNENGPLIISIATGLGAAIVAAFDAMVAAGQFVIQHWDQFKIAVVAAVAVMIPAFASFVVQIVIWELAVLKAWITTTAKAVWATVVHSAQVVIQVAKWVALAVAATAQAAVVVAGWVATGVAAVAQGVVHAAQVALMVAKWVFLGAQATVHAAVVVAGWVATGVAAAAQAAVHVAQVGVMVAKWVFLGAQSLLHAAKVAAAWLIAMGPIAIVAAAVIGLVALFIANFDTIKGVVVAAFNFVKANAEVFVRVLAAVLTGGLSELVLLVVRNWDTIKQVTSDAWNAVVTAVTGGVDRVLGLIRGLPGQITGALGNLGSLLVNAGRDVIGGLIRGVTEKIGALKDKLGSVTKLIPDWKGPAVKDAKLLQPAGRLLMQGLNRGIEDRKAALRAQLGAVTAMVENAVQPQIGLNAATAAAGLTAGTGAAPARGGMLTDEQVDRIANRLADAVKGESTDWDKVARTIGRETAREQQHRERAR